MFLLKNVRKQKADKSICSGLALFSCEEHDELNIFSSLDGKDLFLENQKQLIKNWRIVLCFFQKGDELCQEKIKFHGEIIVFSIFAKFDKPEVVGKGRVYFLISLNNFGIKFDEVLEDDFKKIDPMLGDRETKLKKISNVKGVDLDGA